MIAMRHPAIFLTRPLSFVGEPAAEEHAAKAASALGASEAALALDEEIAGAGLRRPVATFAHRSQARTWGTADPPGLVAATVLPGAYPGTTIRRVSSACAEPIDQRAAHPGEKAQFAAGSALLALMLCQSDMLRSQAAHEAAISRCSRVRRCRCEAASRTCRSPLRRPMRHTPWQPVVPPRPAYRRQSCASWPPSSLPSWVPQVSRSAPAICSLRL